MRQKTCTKCTTTTKFSHSALVFETNLIPPLTKSVRGTESKGQLRILSRFAPLQTCRRVSVGTYPRTLQGKPIRRKHLCLVFLPKIVGESKHGLAPARPADKNQGPRHHDGACSFPISIFFASISSNTSRSFHGSVRPRAR